MAYFLNLFSPETFETFSKSNQDISGFRVRQSNAAKRIKPGDKLICYMTIFSRWVGVLEVLSDSFEDNTPIFYDTDDPFIIRFKVKPLIWLSRDEALPIKDQRIWTKLSLTRDHDQGTSQWTGRFRNSLNQISEEDGKFLEDFLINQTKKHETFNIADRDFSKYLNHKIKHTDKTISVSIPQDTDEDIELIPQSEVRESIKIQALLANIGMQMKLKIWLPQNDRNAVLSELTLTRESILDSLPLNYDETTIKTIEQIDVIWLRGRSIVRAFEVEHTTSIYSGILRMADLLALQPNMDIKLHIVAPIARRDKVFRELRRPVFSLLERGPLSEYCTFLSYDSVRELAQASHLPYMINDVLDEYIEEA